jgi:flagellar biosynthetic protein FlhB
MADERTEQPTAKKLRDARKKGQVARSRDLAVAGASLAGIVAVGRLGSRLVGGLGDRLTRDLTHFGDAPLHAVTAGELMGVVMSGASLVSLLVGPVALASIGAGLLLNGAQGGLIITTEPLKPNFGKLNPANGLKRLVPTQSGPDLLRVALCITVICWVSWRTIRAMLLDDRQLAWMTPLTAASIGWTRIESLLWNATWGLVVIGVADFALQRYRLRQALKMTKQEVRDEAKMQDGNPEVKGRIRRIQREMARRRMMSSVQRATVVVTNPTHYAVALEYRRGAMAAPVVLAKGRDHVAAAIKQRARDHGVPIVENKPLAQALYASAEIGQAIPAQLFAAVAEVLAQLIRLKQLVL